MKTLSIDERLAQVIELSCAASEATRGLSARSSAAEARIDGIEQRLARGSQRSGFTSFGEFLRVVRSASFGEASKDSRLQLRTATGIGEDGAPDLGGFIVPEDYSSILADLIRYGAPIASRTLRIPAKRRSLSLPAIDETSRANGSRWGGVNSGWANEGDLISSGKPKFRSVNLEVNKFCAFIYATEELTEDGPLGIFVSKAFAAESGHVLDDMIFGGNGAGQPLGILNAPATIVVAKESGQGSGTIVPQNVANMLARILPECLDASVWLMSTDMLASLYMAPLVVATPGSSVTNLFTAPDADAPYGRLMTRPVVPVEQASAIGTLGDIILADLSKYLVLERPLDIKLSLEVRFINGEGAYRFTYRVDGQPLYVSAITPKNGGPTKSAFVTLAAR